MVWLGTVTDWGGRALWFVAFLRTTKCEGWAFSRGKDDCQTKHDQNNLKGIFWQLRLKTSCNCTPLKIYDKVVVALQLQRNITIGFGLPWQTKETQGCVIRWFFSFFQSQPKYLNTCTTSGSWRTGQMSSTGQWSPQSHGRCRLPFLNEWTWFCRPCYSLPRLSFENAGSLGQMDK